MKRGARSKVARLCIASMGKKWTPRSVVYDVVAVAVEQERAVRTGKAVQARYARIGLSSMWTRDEIERRGRRLAGRHVVDSLVKCGIITKRKTADGSVEVRAVEQPIELIDATAAFIREDWTSFDEIMANVGSTINPATACRACDARRVRQRRRRPAAKQRGGATSLEARVRQGRSILLGRAIYGLTQRRGGEFEVRGHERRGTRAVRRRPPRSGADDADATCSPGDSDGRE